MSRAKQVSHELTEDIVAFHQASNEMNKMKRLLFLSPHLVAETDSIRFSVGDQLEKDVQHWLSPPDPSTNQNFVSKARHKGTATWFLESRVLTEWKANGSPLWIHGKRTSFNYRRVPYTNNLLILQRGQGRAPFCRS